MKIAASNIAWEQAQDDIIYRMLADRGCTGLEIAPTRLFPQSPYDHIPAAGAFRRRLADRYGLQIVSMQSIWYGRKEQLFGTREEQQALIAYTEKAIDFASELECPNLVFGCPKNRCIGDTPWETAAALFHSLGEYARKRGTVLAIEANPVIYGTDFINTTAEAFSLAAAANSAGIAVNLDIGTMIENHETVTELPGEGAGIHHIHLSEPCLAVPVPHSLHCELADFLHRVDYDGYISLEMKRPDDIAVLAGALEYLAEVFGA